MRKNILVIVCLLLAFPVAVFADSAISYTLNSTPAATDQLLGIDAPSGAWSIQRFGIQAIFDLMEADISGFSIHVNNLASGITDGDVLKVDATAGAPADDEFARFTATGIEGLTVAEVLTALGLSTSLPPIEAVIESFTNSMDDKLLFHAPNYAITLTHVAVACEGTCTTAPTTLTFQDGAGTAMTTSAITVDKDSDPDNGTMTFYTITAGGSLVAGEGVEIGTVAGMSPETDTYFFSFIYTID